MYLPSLSRQVAAAGFVMDLRQTELESVAAGLGEFDASEEGDLLTLVEALRSLPVRERAGAWELVVRRFAHHKPLSQAAGEIGLDLIYAEGLLSRFTRAVATAPAPEHDGAFAQASAEVESSAVARFMSAEILGNAIAHDEVVDLDAAHDASLRAVHERRHPSQRD